MRSFCRPICVWRADRWLATAIANFRPRCSTMRPRILHEQEIVRSDRCASVIPKGRSPPPRHILRSHNLSCILTGHPLRAIPWQCTWILCVFRSWQFRAGQLHGSEIASNRVGGFLAVPSSHTTGRTHRIRRFPAEFNAAYRCARLTSPMLPNHSVSMASCTPGL